MKFKPIQMAAAAGVAGLLTVGGVSMAMAQEEDPSTTTVQEDDTTTVPEDDTTTVPEDDSSTEEDRANCDHGAGESGESDEDTSTTEGS